VIGRTFHHWLTVPVKRTRGLAFLLLACLAWEATTEFTHHHGTQPRAAQRQQVTSVDQADVHRIESTRSNGNSSSSKSKNDCLICQLHQNLSATELSQSFGIGATEARLQLANENVAVNLSAFAAPQHGRAPPANL
jgi:hypothetical protein